jgi:hypothetical protein
MIPDLAYVLPIRREHGPPPAELTRYLRWVAARAELVIVDGSPADVFDLDRGAWGAFARHVRPDPGTRVSNGKAWGVLTGVPLAGSEFVIVADDDVRYDGRSLVAMWQALRGADLVRPQNIFVPMPWHAAWDTARSLLNRSLGSDHPGTLGIRRSMFDALGGYDGNVLFENLELVRTFRAGGATVVDRPDLYVARRPPTVRRFWSQRIRQAYDDLAQPARLIRHLAVLPAIATFRRRPALLTLAAGAAVASAELGRRRGGGVDRFPAAASWWAVPWLLERGTTAWIALALRVVRGGCPYAGTVIPRAASSSRKIRRRLEVHGRTGAARMRSVAQRGELRPSAAAQRDRRPAERQLDAALVEDGHVAAHDQRSVGVDVDRAAHRPLTRRSPA